MPFCNNCGAEVNEEQKFCMECGVNLLETETETDEKKAVVQIDREELGKTVEKGVDSARKGLGAAWRIARKGVQKGAQVTTKGIEAAKETLEERRAKQKEKTPEEVPSPSVCPSCGENVAEASKFCNHCGSKLE